MIVLIPADTASPEQLAAFDRLVRRLTDDVPKPLPIPRDTDNEQEDDELTAA